jgi:protein-disulfide isomerase
VDERNARLRASAQPLRTERHLLGVMPRRFSVELRGIDGAFVAGCSKERIMGTLIEPVGSKDHILGPPVAPVTLLEYGDYECPFSAKAHLAVRELISHFGDDLRFVFRHFPLTRFHPHAVAAAEAAEAAAVQDRFWRMHDHLFAHQEALGLPHLAAYAATLELDVERFNAELELGSHMTKVNGDLHSGMRSGVQATPAFFVNGARFEGRWDGPELRIRLRRAVRSAHGSSRVV